MAAQLPREYNTRAQLRKIGIGDFNATMICRFVVWSPAQTDPDMPAVILLTRAIQETLVKMGANIEVSGALDQPTADCLDYVCGKGFLYRPWWQCVDAVVLAKLRGWDLRPTPSDDPNLVVDKRPGVAGFVDDVPGGYLTLAGAAAALYFICKR
jgi:hypothetical protein